MVCEGMAVHPGNGGKRRLRGEMLMRGREWYPGKWGEASRPEVSRRPEVKGGTPEIVKREECQWWDVHARHGLVPRKAGEASHCRGEMRSKKEL